MYTYGEDSFLESYYEEQNDQMYFEEPFEDESDEEDDYDDSDFEDEDEEEDETDNSDILEEDYAKEMNSVKTVQFMQTEQHGYYVSA